MKRSVTVGLYLAVCACLCMADNAVTNPDFSQVDARDATAPADWRLPDEGYWSRAEVGPTGKPCLAYDAEQAASGPVAQKVQFLEPGVTWELRAKLKAGGGLMPVIVITDGGEDRELGRATAQPGGVWQTVGLRFVPVMADVIVEIYADGKHPSGGQAGAGKVWVAQVELAKIGDADGQAGMPDLGENIALGASYTMTMQGRYSHCADADDNVQLTDGLYTEGYFWTQPSTVGWRASRPAHVTIDLGEAQPIRGMSFGSAAGVAGVTWPASLVIYVSDDGESWYDVADLVALNNQHDPLPPFGQYSAVRLWTDQLRTHGRFVHVAIEPGGPYVFCDEIEIFRGEDAWLAEARAGESVTDPGQHVSDRIATRRIREHLVEVLTMVRSTIADTPGATRAGLQATAGELVGAIEEMPVVSVADFRAVLPMTDLERDIYALQAEVWRAQGKPALRVWRQSRWDPLAPTAEPADDADDPALRVDMMSNEFRADVLNFTNGGEDALDLRLRIVGLPGGDNPDYLTVQRVEHVGPPQMQIGSVAAPLVDAEREGDDWLVEAPAGMTRQVWLAFNRPDLPAGECAGAVEIRAAGQTISAPLSLRIYPLRFPDETTLLVGGWSYANANSYGITEDNRVDFIEHMQEHFVNAPWATSGALPRGKYDAAGNMTEEPSTDNFDAWQADWPDAKMYMVFLGQHADSTFDGAVPGSEMFSIKVGNWARFWADHMIELGLEAGQLGLLVIDEPRNQEQYDSSVAWFNAIDAAAPEIVTWTDPIAREPDGILEMYQTVDVLCPNRHRYFEVAAWYCEFTEQMRDQGTEIWFYSCSGPARSFDPFSYYLMQAWHAFDFGATGSAFWCFSDNGGASCWNEYVGSTRGPYCPIYLDDISVTAAKYMEAIRDSAEDFEYLTMLRSRIEELEGRGVAVPRAAKELLATAPERVMAGEEGANWQWDEPKDRAVQDVVRVEILQTLVELAGM